jgi:hypothetical protein
MTKLTVFSLILSLSVMPCLAHAQQAGLGGAYGGHTPTRTLTPDTSPSNPRPTVDLITFRPRSGGPDIAVPATAVDDDDCQDYFIMYEFDDNGEMDPHTIQVGCAD